MFEVEQSRLSRSDPESIVAILKDSSTWPAWQPEIEAVVGPAKLAAGDSVEGRARLLGFHVVGRATIESVDDDALVESVIVGVHMRVAYSVSREGDHTQVTSTLSAQLPRGLSGRVLSLLLRWRLRRMQRRALERLVAQSEGSAS